MLRPALALLVLSLMQSCATVSAGLSPTIFYKRDIQLTANGYTNEGTLVVPKAATYQIAGSVASNFDYLMIRSCHREYDAEKLGTSFTYTYTPVAGLEDNRACPLTIEGVESTKGRHSFAFIDFEGAADTLPAATDCDSLHRTWNGVGNCQGPSGGFQRATFPVDVLAAASPKHPECAIPDAADHRTFIFKIPRAQCLVDFMEIAAPHRTFRLNLLGYEETVIRSF